MYAEHSVELLLLSSKSVPCEIVFRSAKPVGTDVGVSESCLFETMP